MPMNFNIYSHMRSSPMRCRPRTMKLFESLSYSFGSTLPEQGEANNFIAIFDDYMLFGLSINSDHLYLSLFFKIFLSGETQESHTSIKQSTKMDTSQSCASHILSHRQCKLSGQGTVWHGRRWHFPRSSRFLASHWCPFTSSRY